MSNPSAKKSKGLDDHVVNGLFGMKMSPTFSSNVHESHPTFIPVF
jgi:hypothetical protein